MAKWKANVMANVSSLLEDQFECLISDLARYQIALQVLSAGHDGTRKERSADLTALFHRLIILVERTSDIQSYFAYGLTPVPAALFRNGSMRKPDKPSLARHLIANILSRKGNKTNNG